LVTVKQWRALFVPKSSVIGLQNVNGLSDIRTKKFSGLSDFSKAQEIKVPVIKVTIVERIIVLNDVVLIIFLIFVVGLKLVF
jgi:hypothetical protein